MRLSHATLYGRLLASDPTYDGRFFFGVRTTGIYCLPSCRARKPKPENVRFFPTCEAARAAGLRPCKKCHPDDYARGADPVLETIEAVVAELRADPGRFPDAASLVHRTGYGTTRAHELFRQHFHATPAELLASARLASAREKLVSTDAPLGDVAFAVGYESLSTFNDAFRVRTGLTPSATRALAKWHGHPARASASPSVTLTLPPDYPLDRLLAQLGRDPLSLSERLDGAVYHAATRLSGHAFRLTLDFSRAATGHGAALLLPPDLPAPLRAEAAARVARLLGLAQDAAGFARLAQKLGLFRLVAGRETLRLPQYLTPWDALLWAILGQQINLPFAFRLRRALTELAGAPVGDGLVAPPSPAALADLAPSALAARQFSGQKIRTLLHTAKLVADGSLDLEKLAAGSATRAGRALLDVHGLGPWTMNYVLMRGFGFADCTPYGDTGLAGGLQRLFALDHRPDPDTTRRLMLPFSPHRSLATAHLWQLKA
jgi:AraC family transcriptional regulator, regulatory protein of adaptative response / DNA-3-methyladenine glycosylase II